jgi:hypothetical protein
VVTPEERIARLEQDVQYLRLLVNLLAEKLQMQRGIPVPTLLPFAPDPALVQPPSVPTYPTPPWTVMC